MKTIPPFAFIAALAAFLVLPLSFAVGGTILFAAGLAAIAVSDYARTSGARTRVAVCARTRNERLRLAA